MPIFSAMTPLYFASGSNRASDIRGFDAVGHAVGVAAPEVTESALAAILTCKVPVFVDSGAFSEVEFTAEGPRVVRPMTDATWREVLDLYYTIGKRLGRRAYLVAPDRVGDQDETLRRLRRYAPELRRLRALGCRLLVPIQKGARTQAAFVREVERALGFSDFVHAIPSKKSATTLEELAAYVKAVRPRAVHLLGLGIRNASAPAALAILADAGVTEVSLDSNLIAASVGRGGRAPRRLTAARDRARELIAAGRTSIRSAQELGIILAFGDDSARAAAVAA